MDNKDLIVNGYQFPTVSEANKAREEVEWIASNDLKVQSADLKTLKAMYEGWCEQKIFSTVVGLSYAEAVREKLIASNKDLDDQLPYLELPNVTQELFVSKLMLEAEKDKSRDLMKTNKKNLIINTILLVCVIFLFIAMMIFQSQATSFKKQYQKTNKELKQYTTESESVQDESEDAVDENAVDEEEKDLEEMN